MVVISSAIQHPVGEDDLPDGANVFAQLKSLPRTRAERSISAFWDAVGAIVELFSPIECANYFRAAGYHPD